MLSQNFTLLDVSVHDVKRFDCGRIEMNLFLSRFAQKNSKVGLSKTWVLPSNSSCVDKKLSISAYYTLAGSTVIREDIPSTQSLPAYPVPVTLLARLAVNTIYQNQGLGAKVLITALRQAVYLNDLGLPSYGVVLDVLDAQALAFYEHFEVFKPFSDNPMRLFVPMKVLREI